MAGKIIIEEANDGLDPDALRSQLSVDGCGAIVSFLGITRGHDNDEPVIRLEFDAWQNELSGVLHNLAEQAITLFSLNSVAIAHRTGKVEPMEPIVSIHVASPHRKEAFEGCSWLIDELKRQAPLWKKEVKPSGETWKAGLG